MTKQNKWLLVSDWAPKYASLIIACICGVLIDTRGLRALYPAHGIHSGCSQRHHFIDDLTWRNGVHCRRPVLHLPKNHMAFLRSDNKRPDGLTLIRWLDCSMISVLPVTDTVSPFYLGMLSARAASAADAAAKRKKEKYIDFSRNYHLFPIVFEMFGLIFSLIIIIIIK